MIALAALERGAAGPFRRCAALTVAAALLWLPQAACLALAVASLMAEPGHFPAVETVGFIGLAALRAILTPLAAGIGAEAAQDVVRQARAALIGHVAGRAPRNAGRTPAGALAALAADKLDRVVPYLARYKPARLKAVAVPAAILLATLAFSWTAALILLVAGPLIPVFMALVGMAAREASMRQMDEIGAAGALFLDRLRGLIDIRLLAAEAEVAAGFSHRAERLRAQTMSVLRIAFLSSAVLELFAALGVALVAVYVGFSLLGILDFGHWGTPLTPFEGVFILLLAPEFFQPMRDFAAAWHDRAGALAVHDEFDAEMANAQDRIPGLGEGADGIAVMPGIHLDGVRAHDGAVPLDLRIGPGERLAVIGPSGSGKTALLTVLAGLRSPVDGRIGIGGKPLGPGSLDAWRGQVAWLPQEPHFLAASIRANVALGGDPKDVSAIARALDTASATDIVGRSPRGLDTPIGETGAGISGGEGRRLSIARAAFRRHLTVIADEPTANLDSETAEAVTRGLLSLAEEGATLIVATHDPALAERMDRRIELRSASR